MEVEIVTLVVKGSGQLTVPPDRQEKIQVGSRGVALRRIFDLKIGGIHLTQIILKFRKSYVSQETCISENAAILV